MSILIADDDEAVRAALKLLLDSEHLSSVACSTPGEALEQIRGQAFQLALIDLNYQEDTTSGKEGLELISSIREADRDLPVVVMTGWGTVDIAVEAMKRGAVDFIEKPWDNNNRLITTIRTQIKLREATHRERKLQAENTILRNEGRTSGAMISESPAMKELLALVERVAASDIPVLITGENGTGKSLLARHIHDESARAEGPFVAVNMGGISDSIFESEMFGHVKGAFTDAKSDRIGRVEMAEEGTLFLDEIANMPQTQQPKMLRLLEEFRYERLGSSQSRSASVRVISATNADLEKLESEKGFRKDLLFRLNGITLDIPPLRERIPDIVPLAERFLETAPSADRPRVNRFSKSAQHSLEGYDWPGNIRELRNVVERATLLCQGEEITPEDLQLHSQGQANTEMPDAFYGMTLEEAQHWYIDEVLSRHDDNHTKAARALGISRSALYRRLEKRR